MYERGVSLIVSIWVDAGQGSVRDDLFVNGLSDCLFGLLHCFQPGCSNILSRRDQEAEQ